ncbi:MAG: molybdopterin molybdotransferase MoeA [Methanomicrobiales archaeon]|nr:molybdopterin molybdotransferase MoeA [Methanomicrobiales archaeon]
MSVFLETVLVEEAINRIQALAPKPGSELLPLESISGRVLSEDIMADIDIPGFDRSVVDGYAARSSDTTGAGESVPAMLRLTGRINMGEKAAGQSGAAGSCVYVPTGGEVPTGFDAVAMIEYCELIGDTVLVKRPLANGENIILCGEDFHAGEIVLKSGCRLGPRETGVLAAVGCDKVPVYRIPRIAILSTGNEIVPVTEVPTGSRVRDVNSYLCSSYVKGLGCEPILYGIVPDERVAFQEALDAALARCDAVLISGGSSKDERDMTASVIQERGAVLVHGIAIAPGKPTIIGQAGGIPVIGLPGHPASALIVLKVVVRHLLEKMTGDLSPGPALVKSVALENIPSMKGREEYVRVLVTDHGVTPLFGKSGLLNTLVRSNGLVRVPAGSEGVEEGDAVEVIQW